MRLRSIIAAFVVVLVVAAALYYFYGFRNRAISADINSIKETTSDAATTTAVKTALALNKQVSDYVIHVDTNNGTVTLTGQVPTDNEKKAAEDVARNTKGVSNVANNLDVDPKLQAAMTEKQRVSDLEIKTAVLEGILNNPQLKSQTIKTDVANCEVKFTGSVQTQDQKTAAEALARAVPNVRNVDSNGLKVTNAVSIPVASDDSISAQVESALAREDSISQKQKITVNTNSGVVYLTGTVGSKAEKVLATQVARNVTGVRDVVNNMSVSSKR